MPQKTCPTCPTCQTSFEITPEDEAFYKRLDLPHPQTCPTCRNNARIRWRNFTSLYNRTSDLSGKPIISMYKPDSPLTVYSSDEWYGDQWDPLDYGQPLDLKRPFFEQFHELYLKVPRASLHHFQCENSSYCNFGFKSKACYMVFGCVENEDCLYGHIVWRSTDCTDNLYIYECELCFECIDCISCYNCDHCQECRTCNDCKHCYDCVGCHFCFGCAGLRQKQYCINNEQLSKEEYKNRLATQAQAQAASTTTPARTTPDQLQSKIVHPEYYGYQNEDISGNHVYYSKNCHWCFDTKRCEDCKFLFTAQRFTDVYDSSFNPGDCELCYNCLAVGLSQRLICCQQTQGSSNLKYCDECFTCHDCFGCIGLRHKQNCILNHQYERSEYEDLEARLIKQMTATGEYGEFFPASICPFTYEESILSLYKLNC